VQSSAVTGLSAGSRLNGLDVDAHAIACVALSHRHVRRLPVAGPGHSFALRQARRHAHPSGARSHWQTFPNACTGCRKNVRALFWHLDGVADAAWSSDALALLDKQPCDLLISNVGMVGREDYELMKAALALAGGNLLLALASSGHGRARDEKAARVAGLEAFVTKWTAQERGNR
jgi:CheY-like chemotaxis protein